MAAIKTYILAPNFTYHPNTSICLSDIIADPSDPTKPLLSTLSVPSPGPKVVELKVESHIDYTANLSKSNSSQLQGSIFAKFLELAEARIGGGISRDVLDSYAIDRLETVYFRKQPTDAQAAEWTKDSRVASAMNSGLFGRKPVYMITGLKVARGLRVESGRVKRKEVGVGVGLLIQPAAAEVGVELDMGGEKGVQVSYEVDPGQDVVFAYQLHVITHKGWRKKKVDISVYKTKAALLHEEEDEDGVSGHGHHDEEVEVEVLVANEEDVKEFDDEMPVAVLSARDGDEDCVCISFEDE